MTSLHMESMMHLSSNNHFITKLVIKFSPYFAIQLSYSSGIKLIPISVAKRKVFTGENTDVLNKCSGNQ